ncbi:hypothetical protein ATANTOWER_016940 [Ataeniobius toweri]|uniref:Uncharacterized protein n=1 Tax=Ataeniobius toweri TaxID=208326 RepID=A0ABU7AS00_9TELE|nr:hypothetical protein [Ataeniobius toweri]
MPSLFIFTCVCYHLRLPAASGPENLTEDVSLKEEETADLIKQTKANGQPSALERQDSPKDATLKPTPRRSLFKDQDVSHKRISSVQQEAKSGAINIHPGVRKVTCMVDQIQPDPDNSNSAEIKLLWPHGTVVIKHHP